MADEFDEDLRPPSPRLTYFSSNDRKSPREQLFGADAERTAKDLVTTVPASQLRRFYAFVTELRDQIETRGLADEMIRVQMAMLKARAAYTRKRNPRYSRELVRFFTLHADAVRDRTDFLLGFQPHFEAVIAYHKVFGAKE